VGRDVYFLADIFCKRDEKFTGGNVDGKERCARLRFSGKENVANSTYQRRYFGKRARRRGKRRGRRRELKDRAPDEIGNKIFSGRESYSLLEGNLNFEAAEFLGLADGRNALEMKDAEAGMIAIGPE